MTIATGNLPAFALDLARALGEQRADRDIAAAVRLSPRVLAVAASADYTKHVQPAGLPAQLAAVDSKSFAGAYRVGYNEAWAAREHMTYRADESLPGYVMRACYHCRGRFVKRVGTPEAQEYRDAAIIICVECIRARAQDPS